MIRSTPIQLVGAALAGAFGVLGFGPFGYFWAALLSVAALVWLWWDASTRRAALLGFAWGVGLFGAGVSWVYVSMHVYGNMPPWMAALVVVVFVAILSLYPALVGGIQARWFPAARLPLAATGLPALWALGEWVRGWAFSGFPWLSLGYSQVDSWLGGWSPVLGVYGVSWLLALTAVLGVMAARRPGLRWRLLPVVAALWFGGLALERVEWASARGEPVNVALVQGNVPLDRKWAPEQRTPILNRYLSLTNHLQDRDLIVWPESALPFFIDQVNNRVWLSMRHHPADFVLGLLERARGPDGVRQTFNSVVSITRDDLQIYRKAHLVPFGEYLPLKPLLGWVINYLRIPMADMTPWPGRDQGALRAGGTDIGVTVCYEDAFPEQLMKALPAAGLLVNVSEDAWFGDSIAPHQRIQMARMRAMETARPMLRAANTGVSAVIDHRGGVMAASRQFVPAVVKETVQPMQGATPYVYWGNYAVVLISVLLLAPALVVRRTAGHDSR